MLKGNEKTRTTHAPRAPKSCNYISFSCSCKTRPLANGTPEEKLIILCRTEGWTVLAVKRQIPSDYIVGGGGTGRGGTGRGGGGMRIDRDFRWVSCARIGNVHPRATALRRLRFVPPHRVLIDTLYNSSSLSLSLCLFCFLFLLCI